MKNYQFDLSYSETRNLIRSLGSLSSNFSYDKTKKEFNLLETEKIFNFNLKLPSLFYLSSNNQTNLDYYSNIPSEIPSYLIMLIRAGLAALGITNQGMLTHHKILKKYMVRKKQGKAQITFLAQKGKARGGAKLRLARTKEFYKEISMKLFEWNDFINRVDYILYQSSPRLWSGLFNNSGLDILFSKNDRKIKKIPFTTYKPTFNEINRINYHLLHGKISFQSIIDFNDANDVIKLFTTLKVSYIKE